MSETAPTIREKIDPDGTLPAVTLVRDPNKTNAIGGTLRDESNLIMLGDKQIGTTTVNRNLKTKEAWFNGIKINDDLKGKGYGTAAYLAAVEQAHDRGEAFRTHEYSFSPEASRVWERFVDAGVAEVVEPPTLHTVDGIGGEAQVYSGHVEIPVPQLHA